MGTVPTRRLPTVAAIGPDGRAVCKPRFAVWETTLRCDQRCRFCGTRAGPPHADELTTAEALDVVDQLRELGCVEVAMHGGEAYLRDDWLTLIRAVRDAGMTPTLVTGGRNLDAPRAHALKQAGLAGVAVSIDGIEATHDALRGVRGSHAAALRAVRHLQDAGIAVGCNTQINRRNVPEIARLQELVCALGLYGWQLQLMVPMGRAAEADDLWLQPYDLLEVMPRVAAARRLCDAHNVKLWPGNNLGYFGPYEHILRRDRSRRGHSSGCGGGVLAMGIEANGDVKACSAMASDGYVGGNVRTKRIAEIWDTAPQMRLSRDFTLDDLWGECRACYYAAYCHGGCIWTSSTLLGRHGNNPYCHHRACELLARGLRERLVQVAAAPGRIRDVARFELRTEPAPADWVRSVRDLEREFQPISPESMGAGP